MDQKTKMTAILGASLAAGAFPDIDLAAKAMQYTGPHYGRKALVGQFVHEEQSLKGTVRVDRSERINFDRSKYIPGNGPDHRLGKKA